MLEVDGADDLSQTPSCWQNPIGSVSINSQIKKKIVKKPNDLHQPNDDIAASTDLYQLVSDLPVENRGILSFDVLDLGLDLGGGDARLAAADHAGPYRAGLLVAIEYLRDATVRHPQLSRYDARPYTGRGHLDDLVPYVVRQRTSVYENPAELVYTALSCNEKIINA